MVEKIKSGATEDMPVHKVLGGAWRAQLDDVLVLGRSPSGELYAAASTGEMGANLLMLEQFKHKLLAGEFGEPEYAG